MNQSLRLTLAQKICRGLPPIIAQRVRSLIYPRALAQLDDFEFIVYAQTGSKLKGRTSDFHGYPFSVHGYYDWRRWVIALTLCSPGDAIIEIGANIGTETVGFSDIVGASGHVYAFEPLPVNLAALRETSFLARFHNIHILPYAVGDRCEEVRFSIPSKFASGTGRVLWNGEDLEAVKIECITLDSLIGQMPLVKVIFTDAEGSEIKILQGARQYLKTYNPPIVVEANAKLLAKAGHSLQDLFSEIRGFDYEVFEIARMRLVRLSQSHYLPPEGDWLCLHQTGMDLARSISRSILTCALLPCIPGLNPLTKSH